MTRKRPRKATRLVPVNFRLSKDLVEALRRLAERNRRTMTAELTICLERCLGKVGLWPPQAEEADAD